MSTPLCAPETDEWDVASLDLDAYLDRIGHPRAVPFENVDVVLGTHRGLGLGVISDKLVRRARGGYCYEHALLFAAVLEQLGYPVQRRIARVQPHRVGPRTHMMLTVPAGGVDYLVDVGFGAGMLYPRPLRDGAVVDQAGWDHRLTRDGPVWTLSKRTEGGWQPLHAFDDTPQHPIDYEVAHHYTSTHPRSPFPGRLVVMRLDHGVSRRLVGDELTVEYAGGRLERTSVAPERLEATLRELDVVLDAAELDTLAACLA